MLRVHSTKRKGTSGVKASRRARRVKVSADGTGLVSRAGTLLLRELTVDTGLVAGWTDSQGSRSSA